MEFVTKPHLGLAMLGRVLADAAVVFSWFGWRHAVVRSVSYRWRAAAM